MLPSRRNHCGQWPANSENNQFRLPKIFGGDPSGFGARGTRFGAHPFHCMVTHDNPELRVQVIETTSS
jgi:hypothetical protein